MWPVGQAMTQSSHMGSVKPAMPQASHMRSEKVIEQSNHKKSQVKPAMAQATHMWSMSKAARKQIGTQPEVIRNSDKHAVLPTQATHIGQPMMFQDSTSKCWYPDVNVLCFESRSYMITTMVSVNPVKIQSNHMWPVKAELKKKSQVNTKSQIQKSKCKRDTKLQVKLDL